MLPTKRSPAPTAYAISVRFGASETKRSTRSGSVTFRPASSRNCRWPADWLAEGEDEHALKRAKASSSPAQRKKWRRCRRNKKNPASSLVSRSGYWRDCYEKRGAARTPFRERSKAAKATSGRSPGFESLALIHSGATAWEFHPLPYSPHLGHLRRFNLKERSERRAEGITQAFQCQSTGPSQIAGVISYRTKL